MSLLLKSIEYGSINNNNDINSNNKNMENNDNDNDEINYEGNKIKSSSLSSLFKSLTSLTPQDYTIIANTSNALLGVSIFAIPW